MPVSVIIALLGYIVTTRHVEQVNRRAGFVVLITSAPTDCIVVKTLAERGKWWEVCADPIIIVLPGYIAMSINDAEHRSQRARVVLMTLNVLLTYYAVSINVPNSNAAL